MQLHLNKFITEIGIATTLGIGFLVMKNRPVKAKPSYMEYQMLSMSQFPDIIDKFNTLDLPELFEQLKEDIESMLQVYASKETVPGGQFRMNRLCLSVIGNAEKMIRLSKYSNDMNIMTAAIDCERDELEILKTNCDNILRNYLLD